MSPQPTSPCASPKFSVKLKWSVNSLSSSAKVPKPSLSPTAPRSRTWRLNTVPRWASSRSTTNLSSTSVKRVAMNPTSPSFANITKLKGSSEFQKRAASITHKPSTSISAQSFLACPDPNVRRIVSTSRISKRVSTHSSRLPKRKMVSKKPQPIALPPLPLEILAAN